jgi:hypothetical protein
MNFSNSVLNIANSVLNLANSVLVKWIEATPRLPHGKLDLDEQVETIRTSKGNVFLTKAQNVINDIGQEYISYTLELWVLSLN